VDLPGLPKEKHLIHRSDCTGREAGPNAPVLDPDVMALRRFAYADLIKDGLALLEPGERSVDPHWWQASLVAWRHPSS
jgi:hypothetical protein